MSGHVIKEWAMRNAAAVGRHMTIGQFLEFHDGTDTRYELRGGRLFAMDPPKPPHARIAQNVGAAIDRRSPDNRRCMTYQGAGLVVDESSADYYIPDVVYSCETYDGSGYLKKPRLVVEILSPHTERDDFKLKVPAYAGRPTVEEIWLIGSEERWAQVWSRIDGEWVVTLPVRGEGAVESRRLGARIGLDELLSRLGARPCPGRGGQISPSSTMASAICTALSAAPLRRLSATTHMLSP
jgi:Uma2 family endonuclease